MWTLTDKPNKMIILKTLQRNRKRSRNTNRSLGFSATTKAIGRRPTPTPPRRTPEETSSLHHCRIQESTIDSEDL
jgi:hypothetical protein